jgi:N-carbamoylputrescine amidase
MGAYRLRCAPRRKASPVNTFTIALLQMTAHGDDREANLAKGEAFCRRAKEMGADLALFPEMWSIGYTLPDPARPDEIEAWSAKAVGHDGPFVAHFKALAAQLDMAIALTYLERWEGAPRDTVSILDRHGRVVLTYAKVHTCDFDEEAGLTPGEDFCVTRLEYAGGEVAIGAMICFDREFPESARILMLMGAEVIVTPNACTLESHRLGQFKARAFENMVGLAMTNYAAPQDNGHSIAHHPVAFGEDERARDTLIVEAGEEEGVFLAAFEMDSLRAYRHHEVWGNAFRRPRSYGPLVSLDVQDPFVRSRARR